MKGWLQLLFIDMGYYSFNRAYCQPTNPYTVLENYLSDNTFFVFDGEGSYRKDSLSWYKTNRKELTFESQELRRRSIEILEGTKKRFPRNCIWMNKLEADDVIALKVQDQDTVICNDKDYLTIKSKAKLLTLNLEEVTVSRFNSKLTLDRGNRALAFQLLYGDVVDNIPRLFYGDKQIVNEIFKSSANPLLECINLLPLQRVRSSLAALTLPTPLGQTKDIIDFVLKTHQP